MAVREIVSLAECLVYMGKATSINDKDLALLATQVKPCVETAIRQELRCGVVRARYTDYLPQGNPSDLTIDARYRSSNPGGSALQLLETPVRQIISINVQTSAHAGRATDAWPASSLWVNGRDYFLDEEFPGFSRSGLLHGARQSWPVYPRSTKVIYIAGYSQREITGDVENYRLDASDLRMGVLMTIAANFANASSGGGKMSAASVAAAGGRITSERLGDYAVSYGYNVDLKNGSMGTNSVIDSVFIPARAGELLSRFKNMSGAIL